MNTIVSWNYYGASDKAFMNKIQTCLNNMLPNILILLETRIVGFICYIIVQKLGYDACDYIVRDGFAKGIWMVWRLEKVTMIIVEKHF